MLRLVIFCIFATLSVTNAFWSRCADQPNAVAPDSISSPFCTADRCTASRGEILTGEIFLTPVRAHSRLDVRVTAFVLGIGIPLELDPPYDNACNHLYRNNVFVGCPTVPNVQHLWKINILISPAYPALNNARIRFDLLENNIVEGCVDIVATLL